MECRKKERNSNENRVELTDKCRKCAVFFYGSREPIVNFNFDFSFFVRFKFTFEKREETIEHHRDHGAHKRLSTPADS